VKSGWGIAGQPPVSSRSPANSSSRAGQRVRYADRKAPPRLGTERGWYALGAVGRNLRALRKIRGIGGARLIIPARYLIAVAHYAAARAVRSRPVAERLIVNPLHDDQRDGRRRHQRAPRRIAQTLRSGSSLPARPEVVSRGFVELPAMMCSRRAMAPQYMRADSGGRYGPRAVTPRDAR